MDELYRVVNVPSCGIGFMTPGDWSELPPAYREAITVLATAATEDRARELFAKIENGWNNGALHINNGVLWRLVGVDKASDTDLYAPANIPLPVVGPGEWERVEPVVIDDAAQRVAAGARPLRRVRGRR